MFDNINNQEVSQTVRELTKSVTEEGFRRWHQNRKYRQNIENGTHYFNRPNNVTETTRHSPSQLLQCHRKMYYKRNNAPEENSDPYGIFWFGSHFESSLIVPFLRDVADRHDQYICNSLWIDFTIDTSIGELRVKGETDPVIVDEHGEPIILFEVKTKQSLDNVCKPNAHHVAQLHAYMYGLSKKYDNDINEGILLYGCRTSLDIKIFQINYDADFWRTVVIKWIESQTEYENDSQLPPSRPEYEWECSFCSYRGRCGKQDQIHKDSRIQGFLPVKSYPREKVVAHLESTHQVKLTPTLAWEYPDLANDYGVHDWKCNKCGKRYLWDKVRPKITSESRPVCPSCIEPGPPGELSGPTPAEQKLEIELRNSIGDTT